MRRAAAVRRIALLAAALSLVACEPAVTTPQEASRQVRDSYAWMADAELCPADVMRADMRVNGLQEVSCADAALPKCFRQCRKGDVDSCFWLAHALEQAQTSDPAAQALYQRACTLGEPSGCTNRAAGLFVQKRKDPGVLRCAVRTFTKTCDLDDAWGCTMLGNALHEGLGIDKDDARALQVLEKACKEGGSLFDACGAARRIIDDIRKTPAAAGASGGPGGP